MAVPHPGALPEEQTAFAFDIPAPRVESATESVTAKPCPPIRKPTAKAAPVARKRDPVPDLSTYLTVQQVAAVFGVSRATVWRWASRNPDFPRPVRFSPSVTRWDKAELRLFQTRQHTSPKGPRS